MLVVARVVEQFTALDAVCAGEGDRASEVAAAVGVVDGVVDVGEAAVVAVAGVPDRADAFADRDARAAIEAGGGLDVAEQMPHAGSVLDDEAIVRGVADGAGGGREDGAAAGVAVEADEIDGVGILGVGVGVAEGVVAGGDLPLAAGLGGNRHAGVGARPNEAEGEARRDTDHGDDGCNCGSNDGCAEGGDEDAAAARHTSILSHRGACRVLRTA